MIRISFCVEYLCNKVVAQNSCLLISVWQQFRQRTLFITQQFCSLNNVTENGVEAVLLVCDTLVWKHDPKIYFNDEIMMSTKHTKQMKYYLS